MSESTVADQQPPLLKLPSQSLINILLIVHERRIAQPAMDGTWDAMRSELQRREALGMDDPFETPYPEVGW